MNLKVLRTALFAGLVALLLPACDWMPGKPKKADAVVAPSAVTDFQQLYTQNCLGCHGSGGIISGSIAMDDQTYLALVPPEKLREIIAAGVPGTLMPPFSQANGGLLTDEQITILVQGILAWKKADAPAGLPAYSAPPGSAAAGEPLYAAYVANLRLNADEGLFADGFLANPAFLGLSSDQYLRTLVITGRTELGIPNFQTALSGQPLSDQQISDLVAWLISQRKNEFGKPLLPAKP
ncbi:MAG: c-type cytochrome [Terrimicrobiaceae bacterium]